ncbi:ABC transporter permease [Carnobacterium maltaromaticum]|uniref:ABC transporter permease n=1 Tax=Carnobacterium maltaromaticum TaxID=2751 RepID=UPI00191B9EC4|nr:ABC-2 family transporter protein [Carnobacterium maltaromaticum]CAD5897336.1 ABC transporter permease [Carnobacterium maltaromaticum]
MFKILKKYTPFTKAGIQEATSYRMNFIFYISGNILSAFIMYFLWKAIFDASDNQSLNGFTFEAMTMYIFIFFLTSTITSSGKNWGIGEEIRDGSIAMRILKPLNFNLTYLFNELGNKVIEVSLIAIPILGGIELYRFYSMSTFKFNLLNFSIYIFSLIIAYLINFYFNICFGFSAFFFTNLWGTNLLKNCIVNLLSGAVIPLSFFSTNLIFILKLLPFASFSYTPVMIYMGMYNGQQIILSVILQMFWLLFFIVFSKIIWKIVIKHLCIQGG